MLYPLSYEGLRRRVSPRPAGYPERVCFDALRDEPTVLRTGRLTWLTEASITDSSAGSRSARSSSSRRWGSPPAVAAATHQLQLDRRRRTESRRGTGTRVRLAAAARDAAHRRHDQLRPARRIDPELHLPDHPRRQRDVADDQPDPEPVPAALQRPEGRGGHDRRRAQHRREAGVQRRRQDGDDRDQAGLQVVRRRAGGRRRHGVRDRPAEGGGLRTGGELEPVHAGSVPDERGLGDGAVHVRAGDQARPGLQPELLPRRPVAGLKRRLSAAGDELEHRPARRPPSGLHQPGQREEDLRLPVEPGRRPLGVRDQSAVAGRRWAVQAELVQRHRRLLPADPQPAATGVGPARTRRSWSTPTRRSRRS